MSVPSAPRDAAYILATTAAATAILERQHILERIARLGKRQVS